MLEQIRSFLTVVEEGNLHRAAARLHISQLTLLRQMQVLELELGGRLLERMVTGVRPTAACDPRSVAIVRFKGRIFCQRRLSTTARQRRAGRGVLQKVREVLPEISRPGTKPCPCLRVNRQRKCCSYLAGLRQPPFSARRRHSTLGRRAGDLEDSSDLAERQSRWCSEGITGRPVC
jgi:Bacterial regulatory helix-turn-helix protein, lysR family